MASALSAVKPSQARGKQNGRSQSPTDPSVLLGALQEDAKDIRALIQCGVCVKLLYEPFTLACGHTFCYSCLTQWFLNSRRKKTCPDCRALVTAQPAPAYLVRQIVHMFTSREELFEKYETVSDHAFGQRAETDRIELDKSNKDPREGGLFHGCFNEAAPPAAPIHDVDDGVERCPRCTWELEAGECLHCGYAGGHTDSDMDEINDMNDFAEMDEFENGFWDDFSHSTYEDFAINQIANGNDLPMDHPLLRGVRRRLNRNRLPSDNESDSDEDSSEDDSDDSEMASFISDDEGHDEHGIDRSTMLEDRSFMTDGIDYTSGMDSSSMHDAGNPIEVDDHVEEVETSSDDEERVIRPSRNPTTRRRIRVAPSSPVPSNSSPASIPSNFGSGNALSSQDEGSVSHNRAVGNPSSRNAATHIRRRIASSSSISSDYGRSDALSSEDEGSVSHYRTDGDANSVGTTTTNAITIDDDDDDDDDDEDEAPIRPSRVDRISARRRRRIENRRLRRSQELRHRNLTSR